MYRWFYLYGQDVKWLFSRWYNWLAFIGFTLFIWVFNLDVSSGVINNWYHIHAIAHTVTLGLCLMLANGLMLSDYRPGKSDWQQSLPTSHWTLITTKWFALITFSASFTVIMLTVYSLLSWRTALDPDVFWMYFYQFGWQYEISYLVTTALGLFLGAIIRNRSVLVISFCGLMFGTFFMELALIRKMNWLYLKVFHLSQFLFLNDMNVARPTWGYILKRPEIMRSWLFVAAFALMLIVWSAVLLKQRRPEKWMKTSTVAAIMISLLTTCAFIPYGYLWNKRLSELDTHEAEAVAEKHETLSLPFSVSNYDINVKRTNDDWQITTVIKIGTQSVKNDGRWLFTINPDFRVSSVKVNDHKVMFYQKSQVLYISSSQYDNNAKQQTIKVRYHGLLNEWGYANASGKSQWLGFTRDRAMFIPSYLAWYPLPGKQPLFVRYRYNHVYDAHHANQSSNGTTDFHVHLSGFNQPVHSSSLQAAQRQGTETILREKNTTGLSLFSGDFKRWQNRDEQMQMIAPSYLQKNGNQYFERLIDIHRYFNEWLNANHPVKVLCLPVNDLVIRNNYYDRLDDSVLIPVNSLNQVTNYVQTYYNDKHFSIFKHILNLDSSVLAHIRLYGKRKQSPLELREDLARAYQAVYNYDQNLDQKWMNLLNDNSQIQLDTKQAIRTQQVDKLKRVLKHIYDEHIKGANGTPDITIKDWNRTWQQVFEAKGGR
ncbi:hypothetical protein [Tuberibacillus sp. Marseille-P3662]|uniref:hypothetical protein n=1 Tax=Tuberibacillus sp. Marseille-P3662 TaxID=1965358 RepID=UPI000A1C9C2A|nr:hypothetical protein [Tuberibacillus sp. Marseille-P3662]